MRRHPPAHRTACAAFPLCGAALALLLLCPSSLLAEPYLAVGKGMKCSQCHVNRTGGGLRTRYGATFATTSLSAKSWKKTEKNEKALRFLSTGDAGPFRLGTDMVFQDLTTREDGTDHVTNELDFRDARIYGAWEALPEKLSLYLDERIAPGGASCREALILFTGLPKGGWVKAGRGYLPFDFRMEDEDMWPGRASGFNMDNVDDMVEAGFEPGNWTWIASLSNGTQGAGDDDARKQVTVTGRRTVRRWTIGFAGAHNNGDDADRTAASLHGGVNFGQFTLYGELDYLWDSFSTGSDVDTLAWFAEARWWFLPGQNLRLSWDFVDPDRDIIENGRERFGLGWTGFLRPNLAFQADLVAADAPPQEPPYRDDSLALALRFYF